MCVYFLCLSFCEMFPCSESQTNHARVVNEYLIAWTMFAMSLARAKNSATNTAKLMNRPQPSTAKAAVESMMFRVGTEASLSFCSQSHTSWGQCFSFHERSRPPSSIEAILKQKCPVSDEGRLLNKWGNLFGNTGKCYFFLRFWKIPVWEVYVNNFEHGFVKNKTCAVFMLQNSKICIWKNLPRYPSVNHSDHPVPSSIYFCSVVSVLYHGVPAE